MPAESSSTGSELTTLLRQWAEGDLDARDRLIPVVYRELRRRAAARLRRERSGCSLQPTALVHETYLELAGQRRADWQNRAQFFAIASEIMRRILIDRARARQADRRGGRWVRVPLDDEAAWHLPPAVDVLDLDAALRELERLHARKARVAELRFFAGLSLQDTATLLNVSIATVERDWQSARAWLFARLTKRLR
jgi:RNA polymerase sigma factor (TIGR02999 family)